MKWTEAKNTTHEQFKRLFGVKKKTFFHIVEQLREIRLSSHHKTPGKKRGPKPKLSLEDELLMLLAYYREYRTFFHLSLSYGISEAQCWRIITTLEKALIKLQFLHLPGKKALLQAHNFEVVLVDATETPIERPKRKQRRYYSGKKKRHTIKTQVLVDKKTRKIICVVQAEGRKHDIRVLKESKTRVHPNIKAKVDTGYQGFQKIHANTEIPKKRSKKNPLTPEDKKSNRAISSGRVVVENIIRSLKIFRILAEKYRCRRKRFNLRLNIIAGIYNFECDYSD